MSALQQGTALETYRADPEVDCPFDFRERRMFHMGWFLGYGFGVYGWNKQWAGNVGKDGARPGLFVDMATSLERAGFDYMMLEDSSVLPDVYGGALEHSLRAALVRHDPM